MSEIITNQIKHVDDRALFYDELNVILYLDADIIDIC